MHKIKLIKLLKLLDKAELKKLVELSGMTYFNKDRQVVKLLEFLTTQAPHFAISKKDCFQYLYPKASEKEYDDLILRRLFSKTFKLGEKFIAIEMLDKKPHIKYRLMTEFYEDKIEEDFFKKHSQSWQQAIQPLHWDIQVIEKFLIARKESNFNNLLVEKAMVPDKYDRNLMVGHQLFATFELLIARTFYNLYGIRELDEKHENLNYKPFPVFDTLFEVIKKENYLKQWKENPVIYQARLTQQLVHNPTDKKAFQNLMLIRNSPDKTIPPSILFETSIFIGRYHMSLYDKTRDPIYLKGRMENYHFLLENKLIFRERFFIPHYFVGIVSYSLKINDINYTENFIKEYSRLLPKDYKKSATLLCKSRVAFKKKDYSQVVQLLGKGDVKRSFFYFYQWKILQIKAFFELGEYNVLESFLNAYRVLMTRSKYLSEEGKIRGRNFASAIHQLIYYSKSHSKKKEKLLLLKSEINETYVEQNWLLEKINLLLD